MREARAVIAYVPELVEATIGRVPSHAVVGDEISKIRRFAADTFCLGFYRATLLMRGLDLLKRGIERELVVLDIFGKLDRMTHYRAGLAQQLLAKFTRL